MQTKLRFTNDMPGTFNMCPTRENYVFIPKLEHIPLNGPTHIRSLQYKHLSNNRYSMKQQNEDDKSAIQMSYHNSNRNK